VQLPKNWWIPSRPHKTWSGTRRAPPRYVIIRDSVEHPAGAWLSHQPGVGLQPSRERLHQAPTRHTVSAYLMGLVILVAKSFSSCADARVPETSSDERVRGGKHG
jgi:hypothetical protein